VAEAPASGLAATGAGLPRLLAGLRAERPLALDEHLERLGPLPRTDSAEARDHLFAEVERSGVRGRGGAGFPVATKLRAVAGGGGPRVVVANGSEGEPASRKDAMLIAGSPHLVLDGAELAAGLVGADEVILCVKRGAHAAAEAAFAAVRERVDAGFGDVGVTVAEVSSDYVAGEESALVHHLNGGPPRPTFVPPRPFEAGVRGRPTLMQNVETLAHLALVARYGSAWFRELGTPEDPGSVLVTVSGSVVNPGVYEIASGTELGKLIRAAGGASEPIQAVMIGGYGGSWYAIEEALALGLSHVTMRAAGGTLGPGVVIALPVGACGVAETARVATYLADASTGQCGPCVHGLAAIAEALAEIGAGRAPAGTHEWVARWSDDVVGRGACHHPDGAARLVSSCLDVFAEDIGRHEERGPCRPPPDRMGLLPVQGEPRDPMPALR
jgi:NADH:ubiquinone oxidoreductase subunit F (NADH-binding)